MKITRRQLAEAVAGSAAVALAAAQTPAPATRDFNAESRESHRANSDVLKKFDLPMSIEPAFAFKA
ncbi:MAG TPA: hypothetical protein VG297_00730 [Bryobacteraceae bacterium]|jgi:hypothetical protein|nr:hypothetical protein [Bryobacteraceae bacterium]